MRRGITVIKLLVVSVGLLGLLSLILPAVANTRRAATRMTCSNNLRQLGSGFGNYHDTHHQYPSGTVPGTTLPSDQRLNFYVELLPYMEFNNLYRSLRLSEHWDSPTNLKHAPSGGGCYGMYRCPDWRHERVDGKAGYAAGDISVTNYVGMAGVGADAAARTADAPGIGMFGYDRALKSEDVKDGLGSTIMLIETGTDLGPWLRGGPSTVRALELTGGPVTGEGLAFGGTHFRNTLPFREPRPVAFHVLLGDASVRELKDAVSPEVLAALATVAGGEELPAAW
ncbi:DUF1559 family PulG-like putative transporter [Gemmata sp.]|uniref:DUF1559 family PulG-like putative transporter n=1 Tax=Gemmata sp. TaxID=1914242 RepID=UPI003F70B5FC